MDRSDIGKRSRNKGKAAEIELARMLRDTYEYPVRRGHTFDRESDLVGLEGIHPEVKRVERLNIHDAMKQAVCEALKRQDGIPAVFHRRNRTEWLVTMKLSDWMQLYREWNGKSIQRR